MSLFNDGTYLVGSRVLTIATVAFIAENFSYDEPTAKVETVTDEVGDADGAVAWAGIPTGSATLQLSGSMVIPAQGASFTTSIRGSSITCKILTVGAPEEAQGRKKVNITFQKQLN